MSGIRRVFSAALGGMLGASLAACGLLHGADDPVTDGLSEPDAHAVLSYLEDADYEKNWPFWPGKAAFYEGTRPHGALLMTYVNAVAQEALLEGDVGEMPIGSIIVKENYSPDRTLQAVTIMYKAAEGYSPEHNDWFWLKETADGQVTAAGKVDSCQACHTQSRNDYLMTPLP